MTAWTIREARPRDVAAIHARIVELAVYEGESEAVTGTATDLCDALFRDDPALFCHVAELGGEVVGIALWYLTYSTWEGRHGIHLEDLYVMPEHRGTRIGLGLMRTLAGVCAARGYRRLEWSVLTWNQPSIDFYEAVGARPQEEWVSYRLDGEALTGFAA